MAKRPSIVITCRDVEIDPEVRENIEAGCRALAEEFPETTHFEVTIEQERDDYVAHAHVTGKGTEVAAHVGFEKPGPAAERVLATLGKQLRRLHDKRIFAQRRDAQRRPPKKSVPE